MSTITSIIAVITAIQLVLFAIFIFTTRHRIKKPLRVLAVFLLSNAVFLLSFLFGRYAYLFNINPFPAKYVLFSSGFLFGPFLYWYTLIMTGKEGFSKKKIILHLVPFLLFLLILLILEVTEQLHINIKRSFPLQLVVIGMHLQILFYMAGSIRQIVLYQFKIPNTFSSLEKMNMNWLMLNVVAFLGMWIVDIVQFIFRIFLPDFFMQGEILSLISVSVNFIFANLIIYKGLTIPELFVEILESPAKSKYSGSSLSEEQSRFLAQKLKENMEAEKLFLEPDLTIQELSLKLSVHPRLVSQIINERFQKNFFEFVNHYRVEEAKSLLASETGRGKTVLEILYCCGFNSKSVFNTIFKKSTGMTPTEFRKKHSLTA